MNILCFFCVNQRYQREIEDRYQLEIKKSHFLLILVIPLSSSQKNILNRRKIPFELFEKMIIFYVNTFVTTLVLLLHLWLLKC